MAWKLHDKLDEQDAQILSRSTDTIVKQVAALKEMVEAFRNYARAPSLNLENKNLNGLVSEVLVLYEAGVCKFNARLSADTFADCCRYDGDAPVLHNYLRMPQKRQSRTKRRK